MRKVELLPTPDCEAGQELQYEARSEGENIQW